MSTLYNKKRKILNESDFRYQEQHCGWTANRSRVFPSSSKYWKTIILLIFYKDINIVFHIKNFHFLDCFLIP